MEAGEDRYLAGYVVKWCWLPSGDTAMALSVKATTEHDRGRWLRGVMKSYCWRGAGMRIVTDEAVIRGPRRSAGRADRCPSLAARNVPNRRPPAVGSGLPVGQETGARGVHVQPEDVADAGERERPFATVAAHPGRGLGGQCAGLWVAAQTSALDASCRLFQYGEHEGDRSGCIAHPRRIAGDLRGENHRRFEQCRFRLVVHRLLPSFGSRESHLSPRRENSTTRHRRWHHHRPFRPIGAQLLGTRARSVAIASTA